MKAQPETEGKLPDPERICPVRVKSKNIQENAEFKRNGRKSSGRIAR